MECEAIIKSMLTPLIVDEIWGMDKDDILFGDGGNDVIYGDGNLQSNTSVVWTLAADHGNDIIDGGDSNDILYGQGKDGNSLLDAANDTVYENDFERRAV